jgi:hypothetical protein
MLYLVGEPSSDMVVAVVSSVVYCNTVIIYIGTKLRLLI